jgi:hypothetical protein
MVQGSKSASFQMILKMFGTLDASSFTDWKEILSKKQKK